MYMYVEYGSSLYSMDLHPLFIKFNQHIFYHNQSPYFITTNVTENNLFQVKPAQHEPSELQFLQDLHNACSQSSQHIYWCFHFNFSYKLSQLEVTHNTEKTHPICLPCCLRTS